jgi:hypothetical protein
MKPSKDPYGRCCCWIVVHGDTGSHAIQGTADTLRGVKNMRGLKFLLGTTALLAGMALAPAAQAQIVVGVGVGIQPVCQ